MSRIDIKSMFLEELESEFKDLNLEKYRVSQVYSWLSKGVRSFDEMTNIPQSLRDALSFRYEILSCEIERKVVSDIDGTIKYLFRLNDGEFIEAVLMKYKHGYSMCISTQVGCKMRCSFCETGKSGYKRNLLASEMISQIQAAQTDNGIRISNIVLMGMGEPLDNYKNVVRFLKLVSKPYSLNIGMRHISLSTCGIVSKIYELADEGFQITLSISLHAPNDKIRDLIMPVNKKWNVSELIKACRYYISKTGRRISFEYVMIKDINDTDICAVWLSKILKGMLCHVNLIPVNGTSNCRYEKSDKMRIGKFLEILSKQGINATIRRTLGPDIEASCGQLRSRTKEEVYGVKSI